MVFQSFFEDPQLQKFFLIFVRLSGMMIFVPFFYNRKLSMQLKGGLTFFMALAMYPSVMDAPVILSPNSIDLAIGVIWEMLIGFIIGFCFQLIFMGYQLLGEFVDRQIGFAMASLVDPQTDLTVSILGTVMMNLALIVFTSLGGHLHVIRIFAHSFASLPLLGFQMNTGGLVAEMSELFMKSFSFALEMSLPIIALMVLIHASMGFIQKTIPQLQIFVVGFIVLIVIGLYALGLMLQTLPTYSENLFEYFIQHILSIVLHLRNG